MRGSWWAALAVAVVVGGAPLAAQSTETGTGTSKLGRGPARGGPQAASPDQATHMGTGRRMWSTFATQNTQALAISERLSKYTTQGDLKGDIVALGRSLGAEESALAELDRSATGADRNRVAQVRAHEKEARTHYDELVRAGKNAAAVRQHAGAVHQHLAAAAAAAPKVSHQDDWTANGTAPAMQKPKPKPPTS